MLLFLNSDYGLHGRRKGRKAPLGCEFRHFPIKCLGKKDFCFKWVKSNLTTFGPAGEILLAIPEKIHYFPPGKILPTPTIA